MSDCRAVALKRQHSLLSYHELYRIHWLSTFRSTTVSLMYMNCYSSLLLKMQPLCALSFSVRQLSTARVAGSLLGRLLKLRYILLTGAVGGGITIHQVTMLCFIIARFAHSASNGI